MIKWIIKKYSKETLKRGRKGNEGHNARKKMQNNACVIKKIQNRS